MAIQSGTHLGCYQVLAPISAGGIGNHPNIASIYGLEDSSGRHALVMEWIEGPTVADRKKQGRIPIDEALRIAKQFNDTKNATVCAPHCRRATNIQEAVHR
jgi:serine/threonine protein kinase